MSEKSARCSPCPSHNLSSIDLSWRQENVLGGKNFTGVRETLPSLRESYLTGHSWIAAKFSCKSMHLLASQLVDRSSLPRTLGMSYLLIRAVIFSQGIIIFLPPPHLQDFRQKYSQHYCWREDIGF